MLAFALLAALQSDPSENRLVLQRPIDSHLSQHLDRGQPLLGRCHSEIDYSLDWEAWLDDVGIRIGEDRRVTLRFHVQDSDLRSEGYRKGALSCLWLGGAGTIKVKDVHVVVSLVPDADQAPYQRIDVAGLKVGGLRLDKVSANVGAWQSVQGDAPAWLNAFIQENLNSLVAKLFYSTLGGRLKAWLSTELVKYIRGLEFSP